jgi:hypothetical protein
MGLAPATGVEDVVLQVVAAVDCEADLRVVEAADELARQRNARLEIVVGIQRPAAMCWFGPTVVDVAESLKEHSRALLCAALARVGPDVPVTHRQVEGSARRWALARTGERVGRVVLVREPRPGRLRQRRRGAAVVIVVPAERDRPSGLIAAPAG